ncbi:tRNA glutamyl-Q(34) synthetase GluQRS [Roseibium sp. TrichSKD4]|uniref:tRNA glutamyl-Q(34) synthetase GluQRS n=1 Tax=Roseibium sp. TrichSKD4 TaxID=744980 RepID=UPI00058D5EA4|nr:tRNA glutamyl-Q(34) synthetase GluQRS [Roseibium sp. TrichSKD4]
MSTQPSPIFRFAPSPNGHLHLGHALSALLNARAAELLGGKALLRIENIDLARCTPVLEQEMLEDLEWLGYPLDTPVLRQSERFEAYQTALGKLEALGLVYRATLTRAEIKRFVEEQEVLGQRWPRDPDGAPLYPGDRIVLSEDELNARLIGDAPYALRLNMKAALEQVNQPLSWQEAGPEGPSLTETPTPIAASPEDWGDIILTRKDTPTSYHLSVVVDDAAQGITDVLRGTDLYQATSVHRLLQVLLDLPEPVYRHHRLVLDEDGQKLSKSSQSTSLRALRHAGWTRAAVLERIGLER